MVGRNQPTTGTTTGFAKRVKWILKCSCTYLMYISNLALWQIKYQSINSVYFEGERLICRPTLGIIGRSKAEADLQMAKQGGKQVFCMKN